MILGLSSVRRARSVTKNRKETVTGLKVDEKSRSHTMFAEAIDLRSKHNSSTVIISKSMIGTLSG